MEFSPARREFAKLPCSWQWQRDVMALLQPRDVCRFAASYKDISKQKAYIAELYKLERPFQCNLCGDVVRHPYRLCDCGHVACGMCIYGKTFPHGPRSFQRWRCLQPSDDWKRSCGSLVRRRPERLGAEYATQEALDAAAAAAMPTVEQRQCWEAWHSGPTHLGRFGDRDVFFGSGHPSDFDDMRSVDYRDLAQVFPPSPSAVYRLIVCSASSNFSGFPTDAGGLQRETATAIVTRVVRSGDVKPDDVLIIEPESAEEEEEEEEEEQVAYVVSGWSPMLEDEPETESAEEEEEDVSESES